MKLLRKAVVCPALVALAGCGAEDPVENEAPPLATQKQQLTASNQTLAAADDGENVALPDVAIAEATAQPLVSTWTPLTNAPPGFLDTCLLLTDASVMCHRYNTNQWHRLTPDAFGSYANGTWDTPSIANMPNGNDPSFGCTGCTYAPLYFSSAVLPDGRVVVIGGEYISGNPVWSNIGFLYDPVTNTWSSQLNEAFGGGNVGDASGIVLANGSFMLAQGAGNSGNVEILDPNTLTFTAQNPTGKLDQNNEENWNILYDGTVLTVDARIVASYEIYDPVANVWGNSGSTVVNLADTGGPPVGNSREVGPCVLRPDSTLICFSGNALGQNALYDTATDTWSNTAAMNFPLVQGQTYAYALADGVASLLPNGNVLAMASPVTPTQPFNAGSHFYEFDYATDSLVAVTDSPNAALFTAYQGRMLLLPTGEVFMTSYDQNSTQDVLLYSNGGAPDDAWRPVITAAPTALAAGSTYSISGSLFNGFSEGANYGDDAQMSTNFPLVRITNQTTGHVLYARTHNHSRMGVVPVGSTEVVTTFFDVPATLESGVNELQVVTNGIASEALEVGQCQAATYQAESTSVFHSTGAAVTDGWNIYTNGYISMNHTFTGGATTLTVRARGQSAQGVAPHMIVRVGGVTVGDIFVTATDWQDYTFNFSTTAGSKEIRIQFDNDLYAPPADRNLYIDRFSVNCGSGNLGNPCDSLCDNPTTISWNGSYQSGNLGTGAICRQTTQPVTGGNCGNFASGRQLRVNGTTVPCNNAPWPTVPAARNGGYCIQTTQGNWAWAFVTLW